MGNWSRGRTLFGALVGQIYNRQPNIRRQNVGCVIAKAMILQPWTLSSFYYDDGTGLSTELLLLARYNMLENSSC